MRHRGILFVLCIIVGVFILSACAGGGSQGSTEARGTGSSASAPVSSASDTVDTHPAGDAASADNTQSGAQAAGDQPILGEVIIQLDYERQSGSASNQYAVWIEDMDGVLVKTLYASRWTAQGGYRSRPDSIALWVEKASLATMTQHEVDAVSGATPMTGNQSYTWDLTGADGKPVPAGSYRFVVEGTLRWKNYVLYSGIITLDGSESVVTAEAEYFYESSGSNAALTEDSTENRMVRAVSAHFAPADAL